ncbi:hypothetical protein [Chryseobacterium sp.]|nr:hypothetical protein [Chryseobacterium sp.]
MEKVIIGIDISARTLDICKKEDKKKIFSPLATVFLRSKRFLKV